MLPFFILKHYPPSPPSHRFTRSRLPQFRCLLQPLTDIHPVMLYNVVRRVCKCRSLSAHIHKSCSLLCKRSCSLYYMSEKYFSGGAQERRCLVNWMKTHGLLWLLLLSNVIYFRLIVNRKGRPHFDCKRCNVNVNDYLWKFEESVTSH